MKLLEQAKRAISKGDTEGAISILEKVAMTSEMRRELLLISARLSKWQKNKREGVGAKDEELNKINASLLDLINEVENGRPKVSLISIEGVDSKTNKSMVKLSTAIFLPLVFTVIGLGGMFNYQINQRDIAVEAQLEELKALKLKEEILKETKREIEERERDFRVEFQDFRKEVQGSKLLLEEFRGGYSKGEKSKKEKPCP